MRILTRFPAWLDQAVVEVLALSTAPRARAEETLRAYRQDDRQILFIALAQGRVVGCMGIRPTPDHVVVQHLAVLPEAQAQGVGRRLMKEVRVRFPLNMEAEADEASVEFYRRLGFSVLSIRSVHPNLRRYRCSFAGPRMQLRIAKAG